MEGHWGSSGAVGQWRGTGASGGALGQWRGIGAVQGHRGSGGALGQWGGVGRGSGAEHGQWRGTGTVRRGAGSLPSSLRSPTYQPINDTSRAACTTVHMPIPPQPPCPHHPLAVRSSYGGATTLPHEAEAYMKEGSNMKHTPTMPAPLVTPTGKPGWSQWHCWEFSCGCPATLGSGEESREESQRRGGIRWRGCPE